MKNPITAKRLARALSNADMRPQELANASGVSKASISQYLNGSHAPSNISSGKMASVLGVNPVWLMGFDVPMVEDKISDNYVAESHSEYGFKTKMVKIPIVGTVAAGVPISAIEDIQGYEEIPEQLARTGEFYALRIKGDSMSPDIRNGDVVIVRVQPVADNNDIVIASVNGDEATCKRLKRYETELCLVPINPDYETMRFTPQEVNTLPVSVLGKVIELRRKYE